MNGTHSTLILIMVILVLVATSSCAHETTEHETVTDYERVTIEELTSNTTEYDGRKVEVTGTYIGRMSGACPAVVCPPCPEEIEIIEEYMPVHGDIYRGIRQDRHEIGFLLPSKNGIVEKPDIITYKEILLRGEVEALLVTPPCCGCNLYRSLVIHAHSVIQIGD